MHFIEILNLKAYKKYCDYKTLLILISKRTICLTLFSSE